MIKRIIIDPALIMVICSALAFYVKNAVLSPDIPGYASLSPALPLSDKFM